MKKNLSLLFLLFFLGFSFISCDNDNNNDDSQIGNISIMTNINDPQLFSFSGQGDYQYEYYGNRDENGYPLGIDYVQFVNKKTQKVEATISYDSQAMVNKIENSEYTVTLDWESTSKAIVSITSNDMEFQLNSYFDLKNSKSKNISPLKNSITPRSKDAESSFFIYENDSHNLKSVTATSPNVNVVARLYSTFGNNYVFSSANVYIDVTDKDGKTFISKYKLTADKDQKLYKGVLPLCPEVVDNEDGLIKYYNDWTKAKKRMAELNKIIAKLEEIRENEFGDDSRKASMNTFLNNCKNIFFNIVNGQELPFDATLEERLEWAKEEKSALLNRLKDKVKIKAWAEIGNTKLYSDEGEIEASCGASISSLRIKLIGTTLGKVLTDPSHPYAYQSYVILIPAENTYKGTKIHLYVKGTDSYTRDETYEHNSDDLFPTLGYRIPGAYEGVSDDITVTLYTTDGKTHKKTTNLRFQ